MKRVIIYLLVVFTLSACTNKDRLLSKAKKDAKEMVEKKRWNLPISIKTSVLMK